MSIFSGEPQNIIIKERMRKSLNRNLIFPVIACLFFLSLGFITPELSAKRIFNNVSVFEAKHMIEGRNVHIILDVRTDVEYAQSHIKDAELIPLMVLSERVHELEGGKNILVYCNNGNRSKTACEYLTSKGYKHVYNMLGGIELWIEEGYEVVK